MLLAYYGIIGIFRSLFIGEIRYVRRLGSLLGFGDCLGFGIFWEFFWRFLTHFLWFYRHLSVNTSAMTTSSEDVLMQVGQVRYKKGDGTLYVMNERIAWMMDNRDTVSVSHKYADIKSEFYYFI